VRETSQGPADRMLTRGGALLLAAASLALLPAPAHATSLVTCSAAEFGATGRRADSATRALQRAIDACHAKGGGTAYVPPGEYTTGTLELKDNVTLYLEAGATLFVSQDPAEFPGMRALVHAEGARRIALRGRGRIDGLARYEWGLPEAHDVEIEREEELARRAGVDMRRWLRRGLQTLTVVLVRCRDVLIEDVTIDDSTLWAMRLWGCDGVVVRGVTITSDLEKGANSDGIDIDGSSNVRVSDCRITTGDDAIVLKSGTIDWEPKGETFPVENVTVTNCVLSTSSTAFMIGTESFSDFRHIVFSDSVVRQSNKGFGINVQDGATVSDVRVSNVTMDLRRRHWNWWGDAELLYFVLKKRTPESKLGAIENVVVRDVTARAQGTSRILGHAERRLVNVTLADVQLVMEPEATPDKRTTAALRVDGVDRLTLRDVDVRWAEAGEPAWSSALELTRVKELTLDGVVTRQARAGAATPAVVLDQVDGASVRACRALPGTGLFLSVRGASSRGVRLFANDFSEAKRAYAVEGDARDDAVTEPTSRSGE
jgi:hypothetical protein